jgi:hypothetical protein
MVLMHRGVVEWYAQINGRLLKSWNALKDMAFGHEEKKRAILKDCDAYEFTIDELPFKKYKKKPVVIKAMKLTYEFTVETLEGKMKGNKGDFLIIGVKGELYPCKPDIFHETYEEVKESVK